MTTMTVQMIVAVLIPTKTLMAKLCLSMGTPALSNQKPACSDSCKTPAAREDVKGETLPTKEGCRLSEKLMRLRSMVSTAQVGQATNINALPLNAHSSHLSQCGIWLIFTELMDVPATQSSVIKHLHPDTHEACSSKYGGTCG